jgi:regulator of ribonuclease activity A
MTFTTAQLCDQFSDQNHLQIAEPLFKAFGGNTIFSGQITTLKVFEDDVLVRQTLTEKVTNRVLVIDGGGSHRCALLDYDLARLAVENGWQGVVIYGCIRHSVEMNTVPIGVRALHAQPMYSHKRGIGERDNTLTFAGVNFKTDYFLYADADGIIVCETLLS